MESLVELDALLERYTESERNSSSNSASVEPKIEKQDKAEDVEVVRVKQEHIIADNSGGQAEDVCSDDSESLTGSFQIAPEQSTKNQPDDGSHHEEKLLSLLEKDAFEVSNNTPEEISPTPFSKTLQIKDFAAIPSSSKESPTGVVDKDEFQLDLEADLGAEYEDERLNTLYELCSVDGGNKNWSAYPVFLRQLCVVRAPRLYCTICAVTITGGMPCIRAHLDGKKHKARLVSVQLAQETLQSTVSKLGLKPVFTVTQPYSESLEAAAEAKKKRFVPRQVGISSTVSSTDTLAPTSKLSLLTRSLQTGVSFPVGLEYMAEVVEGGEDEVPQIVAPPSYICLLCQQESPELTVAVQHVQSTGHVWRYWQSHCPRACLKFAAKPDPQQWSSGAVAVMRQMIQRLEAQLGRLHASVVRRTAWQDRLSVVCQEILLRNTQQHWTEPPDLTFHDLPNPFPNIRGNRTETVPVPLQANLKLEIGTEAPVFAPMEVDFKLDILGFRTTAVSESSLDLDDKEDIIQREIERFRSQHKVTLEGDSVVPMHTDKIALVSDSLKVKKDSIMARLAALKRENQPGDQRQAKQAKEEDDDVIVVLDTDSRSSSNRKRRRSRSRSNSRSRRHHRRRSRSYSRDRRRRSRSVSSISSLSSSSLSSARSRSKSHSGNRYAARRNNRSQRRSKTPPHFHRERDYKNAPKGGASADKAHKNALPPEYQPPQYMRDALPYPYDSEKGVALPKPAPTLRNVPSTPLVPSASVQSRWNNMNRELSQLLQTLARKREFYGKQPEQHPRYAADWKQFWEAKYRSLRSEGKDADHYDYTPEWIVYWQRRLGELDDEFIREQKEQLKVMYRLTTPQTEAAPPPAPAAPSVGTKEAVLDPQNRKPVKIQWKKFGEVAESPPTDTAATVVKAPPPPGQDMEVISSDEDEESLSDQGSKRASNALVRPEGKSLTKVTSKGDLLQVLRMLTALEEHLGSLGPLVNTLLSRALALERTKGGGSAKELLADTATIDLLDTAKEKLRGQVEAGILDRGKANAAQSVIQTVTQLIEQVSVAAKVPPSPRGTGVMVMAQQIAQVLQTQGQTSVADAKMQSIVASLLPSFTPPEQITAVVQALNTLLPSSAPGRTGVPPISSTHVVEAANPVSTLESPSSRRGTSAVPVAALQSASGSTPLVTDDLNSDELRSLILNFRQLSPSQQKDLVAYLRKLEATQPERVRELRQCIAPSTPPAVPAVAPKPAKAPTLGCSISPLSANRKELASNPSPPPLASSRREPKAASPKPRTSSASTLPLLRAGRPLNLDPDPQRRFLNDDKPVHPQRKVLNAEKPVLVGVGGPLAAAPTLSPAVWTLPSHQQQQQYAPPVQTYPYVPPTSAYANAPPMQAYPSAPPVQTYPDAAATQMYSNTPPMPGYPNTQPVHAYTNPPQTPMDPNYGHYMGGSYYTSQDPTYGRGSWPMQPPDLSRTRPPAPIHPNAYGYPPQSGYQPGYM